MDCFVASLLAMTSDTVPQSRRAFRASFGLLVPPSKIRGRGECRMPDAPAASCAHIGSEYAHEYSQRSHRKSPGIPARNGFNGFLRALPGDRLSCHRRLRIESASLNASIEASGPHDFAVRFRAIRQRRCRVHRIPPRVRDDRERPSIGTGWRINKTVSTEQRNEIFFETGLDGNHWACSLICPSGKSQVYRTHVRYSPIATKFRRAAK
jgi:hypothetical protein